MNNPVYFLSYVEDEPSKHVVRRLFAHFKEVLKFPVELVEGFPFVLGGYGNIKAKASKWVEAAKNGTWFFVVTDLDVSENPNVLAQKWFGVECLGLLPKRFVFRIAVHEIESWIMADRIALAEFLHVPQDVLPEKTDEIADPKATLLFVIRTKCKKKVIRDMLPVKNQHVGIAYNEKLCEFIDANWSISRAQIHSPSLARCISRMTIISKNSLNPKTSNPPTV